MLELHFICRIPGRAGWSKDGDHFRSNAWDITDRVAEEAIGGHIYLHDTQKAPAWHGGRITAWRVALDDPKRKEFDYVVDGDFRVVCSSGWGNEKAIIRR